MKERRRPLGSSDPLSYICTCALSTSTTPNSGIVLLFYRYFASPPSLPSSSLPLSSHPSELAAFHTTLTRTLSLGGKIRVAKEGFNITVGGTREDIEKYMEECLKHWSFAGLEGELDSEEKRRAFFKPSGGCACVFGGGESSVRVCAEITPMGVTDYVPQDWSVVEGLNPAEFHDRCWEAGRRKVLVDVRNHYESRIGYFVDPLTGKAAVRPGVRRFGQWPQFVKANVQTLQSEMDMEAESGGVEGKDEERKGAQYLTYCTGGIRCEKGARFLAENLPHPSSPSSQDKVFTLKGGIQAYLMWMDAEIAAGRKLPSESLFKGKNYIFDARGSTGLNEETQAVSECHICGKPEDRLSKCRSKGCHLILVVCEECEKGDPRCCSSCLEMDGEDAGSKLVGRPRPICDCEKERELKLWGDKSVKAKPQGRRKTKKLDVNGINIQIKVIN